MRAFQELQEAVTLLSDGGYARDDDRERDLKRLHRALRQLAACLAVDAAKAAPA